MFQTSRSCVCFTLVLLLSLSATLQSEEATLAGVSLTELRGWDKGESAPGVVFLNEDLKSGLFRMEKKDVSSPDDGVLTLVSAGGQRYKRVYSGGIDAAWFGVIGDGVADDTAAMQAIADYSSQHSDAIVFSREMTIRLLRPIIKPHTFLGLNWHAPGHNITLDGSQLADGEPLLKIAGGSGKLCHAKIEGFIFKGNAHTTAVEIAGQCGQRLEDCVFKNHKTGVLFHNDTPNAFTEWCTTAHCNFEPTVEVVMEYRKTETGSISFHGSGMLIANWVNRESAASMGPIFKIGKGCLPYNCPLFVQVWFKGDSVLFENNNTAAQPFTPSYYGDFTAECFEGKLTLGGGTWRTYFTGAIHAFGEGVESGLMVQCENVVHKKNSSAVAMGARWNGVASLKTGVNAIPLTGMDAVCHVSMQIIGDNYDFRYVLLVDKGIASEPSSLTVLANPRAFNAAGWGAPELGLNAKGELSIANPAFPTQGAKLYITCRQLADQIPGNFTEPTF